MEEERPIPESLLEIAQEKKERGKLTIYLGAMPGVGKTYAMLMDAHIKKQEGIDIKIGLVETHGRKETEELLKGLDIIPPLEVEYHGIKLKELNLDEILRLKPKICVVDELPHSNPPMFRNKKRYQDIEEILNAGIDVWTAMNIQHLESVSDIVYQITGVRVKETVPDEFFKNADEIKLIDLPPEELIQRLKEGKVYVPDLAQEAMRKYFRPGNIMALRELAMRIAADKLDKKLNAFMKEHAIAGPWAVKERIVVGIYASPFAEHLVRAAYRVASEADADLVGIYVETEKHAYLTDKELNWLRKALDLAKSLGAEIVWIKDNDVANAIIKYIKSYNITKIIIGKPKKFSLFKESIFSKIVTDTKHVDIYLLDPPVPESELFSSKKIQLNIPKLSLPKIYNIFVGVLLVFISAFIGVQFRNFLNELNLVILFLIVLSLAAIRLDTYSTIFTTLVSILIFGYFFVPPYYSFEISDINLFLSYAVFATMIVFINLLSVKLKRNLKQLQKSEQKSNVLFELSRKLLRVNSKEEAISITVRYVKMFVNDVAILLRDKEDISVEAVTKNINIDEKLKTIAKWCFKNKKPAGFSTQTFSEEPYFYLPLIYKDDIYGVMIFDMSNSKEIDFEKMTILETIADLFTASIAKYL
jgi:two-component system sensor histidine kinase KdpD